MHLHYSYCLHVYYNVVLLYDNPAEANVDCMCLTDLFALPTKMKQYVLVQLAK